MWAQPSRRARAARSLRRLRPDHQTPRRLIHLHAFLLSPVKRRTGLTITNCNPLGMLHYGRIKGEIALWRYRGFGHMAATAHKSAASLLGKRGATRILPLQMWCSGLRINWRSGVDR